MMKLITIIAPVVLAVACVGTALPPLSAEHPANPDAQEAAGPRQLVALGRPVRLPTPADSAVSHAHHEAAPAQHMPGAPGHDTASEHAMGGSGGMHAEHHGQGMAAPADQPGQPEHAMGGAGGMHAEHHGQRMAAPADQPGQPEHAMGGPGDMHAEHEQEMAASGDAHAGHGAHWMAPKQAAARVNPVAATADSIAQGKRIFANNCVTCHGVNGEGDGPLAKGLDPKPANLAAMATQHPDGDFAWKVAHGRGAMPAWKDILSERDIWHTVNYIKALGSGTPSHTQEQPADARHGQPHHGTHEHHDAAPATETPR
ncbi:MAG: c-type cytochrome [Gammaproteobacteria bacterium]|nr:c-type cytochrome [Gammaproteobacteria bacterium]